MKVYYRVLIGAVIILVAVFFFRWLVGDHTIALVQSGGPVAAAEWNLIRTAVFLMLLIVVPTLIVLFAFAWKYRADNPDARRDLEATGKPATQAILWALPAVIVLFLGILGWQYAHALDPYTPIQSANPPLTVEVIALQWKWLFIYPAQGIATVNMLEFPQGTPVHFELTADGPSSSFWIPQLGSQIYAMPAMQTQLYLQASTTGDFVGKNTEINGIGYSGMTFDARSVSAGDFDAWVDQVKQSSSTLDGDSYAALAQPSTYVPPAYYGSVVGDLYDTIIMNYMMPSSTMMPGMPGMDMGSMSSTMKMTTGTASSGMNNMPGMNMPGMSM